MNDEVPRSREDFTPPHVKRKRLLTMYGPWIATVWKRVYRAPPPPPRRCRRERVKTWEISKKHVITWFWTVRARIKGTNRWFMRPVSKQRRRERVKVPHELRDQVHPLQAQHVVGAVHAYTWSIVSLSFIEYGEIFSTHPFSYPLKFNSFYFFVIIFRYTASWQLI